MTEAATDADALARACAEAMYARDRAARAAGMVIEDVRAGYARVAMTVTDAMLNGHDIAHGGFTFMLADTAFAYACNSRNLPNVALQCSISFAAPVHLGDRLVAEGEQRSGGNGRTGVYDITVSRADGEMVALFRGVCYRVKGTVLEG
ncbi:phenylacetic acid degradation protein PaaD [Vulcanimicrobium alpinum]|uniref:Phenylacetic acid degradation protein PaaD n=1 Tax=Vulcanimicrobium alpinum TaxID=3016050 RepID=A0AAN2C996_UNVUL|nr:hydroxyphenylacetyl-CoA thioesterase PaaI [Vulcanimicrobium alpinum]BDE05786.1 phenylacetic acid degradation protein PaaD [Vulcanimicrobium alpinum]